MRLNNLNITLDMINPEKKRQIEINIMEELEVFFGLDSLDADLVFPPNTNTSKKFHDCIRKFIQENIFNYPTKLLSL